MAMDNHEPAFPQDANTGNLEAWRMGMSLRDYFAAAALTIFSSPDVLIALRAESEERRSYFEAGIAQAVYAVADAMLVERDK